LRTTARIDWTRAARRQLGGDRSSVNPRPLGKLDADVVVAPANPDVHRRSGEVLGNALDQPLPVLPVGHLVDDEQYDIDPISRSVEPAGSIASRQAANHSSSTVGVSASIGDIPRARVRDEQRCCSGCVSTQEAQREEADRSTLQTSSSRRVCVATNPFLRREKSLQACDLHEMSNF